MSAARTVTGYSDTTPLQAKHLVGKFHNFVSLTNGQWDAFSTSDRMRELDMDTIGALSRTRQDWALASQAAATAASGQLSCSRILCCFRRSCLLTHSLSLPLSLSLSLSLSVSHTLSLSLCSSTSLSLCVCLSVCRVCLPASSGGGRRQADSSHGNTSAAPAAEPSSPVRSLLLSPLICLCLRRLDRASSCVSSQRLEEVGAD